MNPYQHQVQYYETDKMGITHHSNYIRWMEEARVAFLAEIGWGYDALEASGIISPVTAVQCNYKASTTFADLIQITLSVLMCNGIKLKLRYEMRKADGTPVCEAFSEHCFLNKAGQLLRLQKEHPAFYQALQELIEES